MGGKLKMIVTCDNFGVRNLIKVVLFLLIEYANRF